MSLDIAALVAAESPYQRAAALWVAERTGDAPDLIAAVNFAGWQGGYCSTCASNESGLEFWVLRSGRVTRDTLELDDMSAGQFIEECVAILARAERAS